MSRVPLAVFMLVAGLLLAACADDDQYPVSGEDCAPGDPVVDIETSMTSCVPAGA